MADPPEFKVLKRILDGDDIDRLSALSDCVLLHILSLLETKEAAATAILSRRWRNLFSSLPDIDLEFCVDNDNSDGDRLFSHFISFTNRVIGRRNDAPIRMIRLCVEHLVESYRLPFESLLMSVAAAFSSHNVQDLDISVRMDKATERLNVSIPPGMLSSKTLVSLSIKLEMDWDVLDIVSLPNLKYLYLYWKEFTLAKVDSVQRFLQGCPLLEVMILSMQPFSSESESESDGEESIGVEVLHISSVSLKILCLFWIGNVESKYNVVVKSKSLECLACFLIGQQKVTIDTPNLKSLHIHGPVLEVDIIQNLVSIDKAIVEADFLCNLTNLSDLYILAQHAFKFISGLQSVRTLNLSEKILKPLYFSQLELPTFKNLIKLELISPYCHSFPRPWILEVLSNLFERFPNLEMIIFSEVFKNYFGDDEEFDTIILRALPLNFVEHLKSIEIKNFKGEEHEFKLLEYFLNNGKSLENIALEGEGWKSVPEHLDRILSFEKSSEDCQIIFRKKRIV